jgi:hypothetical protein
MAMFRPLGMAVAIDLFASALRLARVALDVK